MAIMNVAAHLMWRHHSKSLHNIGKPQEWRGSREEVFIVVSKVAIAEFQGVKDKEKYIVFNGNILNNS